jgi:hypothetical protein
MTKFKSYDDFKSDVKNALKSSDLTLAEIYHMLYVGSGKKAPLRLYGSLRCALGLMVDEGILVKGVSRKYHLTANETNSPAACGQVQ